MSKLVVLSGIPGSGKSFFSKLLRKAKGGHVYVVSSDELRTLACGSPQIFTKEKEIWTMFYELPKVYSVDKEAIVIMDATQIIKKFRTEAIKPLRPYFDEIAVSACRAQYTGRRNPHGGAERSGHLCGQTA